MKAKMKDTRELLVIRKVSKQEMFRQSSIVVPHPEKQAEAQRWKKICEVRKSDQDKISYKLLT